ncbi:hypothetical protein C6500_03005 [Candidatus Poribacteria bacterium]|nr:MAG: hypothetical protein C6500_03005 [Candidatus Poribacteria bacterium]
MAITYDFIVYSSRTSATGWILGMRALHGEVPLDIVIPDEYGTSDPENPEVVGVLTTEGLERESVDGLELYRYLRQLNPKKNNSFGYNEVVIRNIHSRLSALKVDEEIRVQVTYSERRETYTQFSYHIKLIGIFGGTDAAALADPPDEIAAPFSPEQNPPLQEQINFSNTAQPVYKTTNTLDKLISFTQNLQKELTQTRRELADMADKVLRLEDERRRIEDEQQRFSEIHNLIEDIFDRLNRLELFDPRIQSLEADRHQLHNLQQNLRQFLLGLHQQARIYLQESADRTEDQ